MESHIAFKNLDFLHSTRSELAMRKTLFFLCIVSQVFFFKKNWRVEEKLNLLIWFQNFFWNFFVKNIFLFWHFILFLIYFSFFGYPEIGQKLLHSFSKQFKKFIFLFSFCFSVCCEFFLIQRSFKNSCSTLIWTYLFERFLQKPFFAENEKQNVFLKSLSNL